MTLPEAPCDDGLPSLSLMIDAAEMATVFQRAIGEGRGSPEVQAHCLRYKPGTNLVVHYLVGVDGPGPSGPMERATEGPSGPTERETQWHHATAMIARNRNLAKRAAALQNQALACQIDGRCPAAWPLYHDEEVGALVQWLPLDIKLPALALRPPALREALRAAGVDVAEADTAMVAYRPRRRAVVRLGEHVLKVYADQADFDRSVRGLESGGDVMDVRTPTIEAALSNLRVTVQAALPGVAVPSAGAVAEEAGRLIAALHACPIEGVEILPTANQLERAARSADLAAVVSPNLAPRLRDLLAVLDELRPDGLPVVRAHGDFHAGQLLVDGGDMMLIDLDEACQAPPALDVANYAAHLVRGAGADSDAARDCLEALVEGYGSRPDGLAWYTATAVLRRAPFPFRFLDERWPEGIAAQVDAAEAALSW